MNDAFLLLIFGFMLIFLEFFLPGAIIGSIGALLVLLSIFLFAQSTNDTLALVIYVSSVVIGLIYVIKIAIKRMERTAPNQTICSDDSQVGYVASAFNKSVIGKRGIVLSDLKPGGYILVDGEKLQAISISGYLPKGTEVDIIDGEEESLIVRASSTSLEN